MYRDRLGEGGLESLTAPLKERYPVTITKKNLPFVSEVLKG